MAKKLLAALLAASMCLGLFGCGGSQPDTTGTPAPTQTSASLEPTPAPDPFEPTSKTIKVSWFTPWWLDPKDFDFIFDEFARKYPEYTIEKEELLTLSDLMSAVQAGNQPDIWMGGDPNQTNFYSGVYQSLFAPLDDYLEKDPDMNFNNVDKSQLDLCKLFDKHFALPYQTSQFCIVYNKKLFAQAGLDPEKPPRTWTELYEYARKLTKFDSNGKLIQMGIIDGPYQYQLEHLNKTNGCLKENGVDSNMNSEWLLRVHEYADSFSKLTAGSDAPADVKFAIENGNAAMTANGNLTYLNAYAQAGIDFGLAKYPIPDEYTEQVTPALLWYYLTIPEGAKNPNGGWLFAKFAMSEGLYQTIARDYQKNPAGIFPQYIAHAPTRQKVYDTFLPNLPAGTGELIQKRDAMMTENIYPIPFSPIHLTYVTIQQKWAEKQNSNEVGLKERLQGIHKEYQAQLATWKKDMEAKGWQFPENGVPVPPWK